MERRSEIRLSLDQTVCVTSLGSTRHVVQGKAADLSGRGMRVVVPSPLPPGDPVRIDLDDALLLGEVCYCNPHDDGFVIGIHLDQALNGLADLARLNDALLEAAPSERSDDRVILLDK